MKNMAITKIILFLPLEGRFCSQIPAGGTCDKTQFGTLCSSCLFTFPLFIYTINMKMEPNVCNIT